MKKLFPIVSMLFIIAGCASNETAESDTVKQSEIYQKYKVSYYESGQELSVFASFRFGGKRGTTLHLVKPSKITFNGTELPVKNNSFKGTFYRTRVRTALPERCVFKFVDADKKAYVNDLRLSPISVGSYKQVIDTSEAFTITWEGAPLGDDEFVEVTIRGDQNNHFSKRTETKGVKEITIYPEEMRDFQPGKADIQFERHIYSALKQTTRMGGEIKGSYHSKKMPVRIIK